MSAVKTESINVVLILLIIKIKPQVDYQIHVLDEPETLPAGLSVMQALHWEL